MGSSGRLVDGAVEKATHTIVTDAIETLLFDEGHTRETYRKHEKELSKSSLPGVIPISQQLFAPPTEGTQTPPNEDMSTPNGKDESFKENRHAVSPSQLEAAAALMKQAGAGKSRESTETQPSCTFASVESRLSDNKPPAAKKRAS